MNERGELAERLREARGVLINVAEAIAPTGGAPASAGWLLIRDYFTATDEAVRDLLNPPPRAA